MSVAPCRIAVSTDEDRLTFSLTQPIMTGNVIARFPVMEESKMTSATAVTEVDIISDVITPDRGDLPPEVAQSVLAWKFTQRAVTRMDELAERNRSGAISPDEREELEKYLRVGTLINLLQAKARLSLVASGSTD
jgi:hypothetical protein